MAEKNEVGILAFGAYVPRLRLSRKAVAEANAWFNPALKGLAKGERSMCNWDEDSVTMAVEAARDCLIGQDRGAIKAVSFASTTLPFEDRLNAGIVAEALNLKPDIAAQDLTASQRAATSGLIAALQMARGGGGPVLMVASEKRRTRTAGPLELQTGDGAAAFLVGTGPVVARLLASATRTVDFVDHYRGEGFEFDYTWEERWIRGLQQDRARGARRPVRHDGHQARGYRPLRHAVRAAACGGGHCQEGGYAGDGRA
jgi:3-hydroxy-3-methylglutaryl CoA synthase